MTLYLVVRVINGSISAVGIYSSIVKASAACVGPDYYVEEYTLDE